MFIVLPPTTTVSRQCAIFQDQDKNNNNNIIRDVFREGTAVEKHQHPHHRHN